MSTLLGNGGLAMLAGSAGAPITIFDASESAGCPDKGKCNSYQLSLASGTQASNFAKFKVTGDKTLQYGSEFVTVTPSVPVAIVNAGGNANGITKIVGWGETPAGSPSSVRVVGFVRNRK